MHYQNQLRKKIKIKFQVLLKFAQILLDYLGRSRISAKGFHIMYKGVGVRLADLISLLTKIFHFHRIFKKRGQGGGLSEHPEPPLSPSLKMYIPAISQGSTN